jgi:hypothetical protein
LQPYAQRRRIAPEKLCQLGGIRGFVGNEEFYRLSPHGYDPPVFRPNTDAAGMSKP